MAAEHSKTFVWSVEGVSRWAYWSSSIRVSGGRYLGVSWAMSRKWFEYQARTARGTFTGEDLRDTTVVGGCSSVWEIADLSGGTLGTVEGIGELETQVRAGILGGAASTACEALQAG